MLGPRYEAAVPLELLDHGYLVRPDREHPSAFLVVEVDETVLHGTPKTVRLSGARGRTVSLMAWG